MPGGATIDGSLTHDAELTDRTVDGDMRRYLARMQAFSEGGKPLE